ncbi:MAG: YbjQ family protein [Dehalococcoidia bacterium]
MLITSSETVAGFEIAETLGLVTANSVRARHIGRDILAGMKNVFGGEVGAYRELLNESRAEALQRLEEQAAALGADAVVALRLATADVMQGVAEILAYGTAVKLRK